MLAEIENLMAALEEGRISRRHLMTRLGVLAASLAGAKKVAAASKLEVSAFKAVGLNHIALRVTDVRRSREFCKKHLGLTVMR